MEKITATTYDTIDPYQWVTDLAHEAWKARDQEVWDNNLTHILHHRLVAKIKAQKADDFVGWAMPTRPY